LINKIHSQSRSAEREINHHQISAKRIKERSEKIHSKENRQDNNKSEEYLLTTPTENKTTKQPNLDIPRSRRNQTEEVNIQNYYTNKPSREFETPFAPQLKKPKIAPPNLIASHQNQQEELKKLFGFELREIKKTNSNHPSTEKPPGTDETNKTAPPRSKKTPSSYWGRGYHLNYPNYA